MSAERRAAPVELSYDELVEQLYNLERRELRLLAHEALLMSDGPHRVPGLVDGAAIRVTPIHPGGFWVQPEATV